MAEFIIKYDDVNNRFFQQDVVVNPQTNTIELVQPTMKGISKCISMYLGNGELIRLLNEDEDIKNNKDIKFRLVYHSAKDLYSGRWQYYQETLTDNYWQVLNKKFSEDYANIGPLPIIHLTTFDIFGHVSTILTPNRYKKIIDSSIWNYYVPLDVVEERGEHGNPVKWKYDDNYSSFLCAIKEIVRNKANQLYDLAIAHEYVDLNARLLEQSHLEGSHNIISPFLFHSEHEMKRKTDVFLSEIDDNKGITLNDEIKRYRWRFLLLDDKIDKDTPNGVLASSTVGKPITKCDILKSRIQSIFADTIGTTAGIVCDMIIYKAPDYSKIWMEDNPSRNFLFICVENIADAESLMKEYEFDIILLDYLLGKVTKNGKEEQEYGYALLEDINNAFKKDPDRVEGYKIGPQGKCFFMFISAFTTAISERLNALGLSRNEDIWEIGEGACPTNTPELFKYRFLHLMKRRLEQTGISELNVSSVLKIVEEIFLPQADLDANWIESVRKQAYNCYHKILGLHYDYSILRENDRGKSVLVDSFLEKQVHLGEMLEHLLQMIHLVAFGTVRQWPEIWEEFQTFVRTINATKEEDKETLDRLSREVEKYIIHLKAK